MVILYCAPRNTYNSVGNANIKYCDNLHFACGTRTRDRLRKPQEPRRRRSLGESARSGYCDDDIIFRDRVL